jgi:hypothetical protein
MGVETALAIGAGSSLVGSVLGYGEQRAARKRQERMSDQAINLTQGANPVDSLILQHLSRPNSGQDGFLQMLRNNPNALKPYTFDYSQAFKDLQARDQYTINDQVSGLRAGAGSLGERFGGGFASREALLRGRFGADISARNAGIAQSSFNNALQFGSQGYAVGQQQNNALLGLLLNSEQGRTQQQLAAMGMAAAPLPSTAGTIAQGGVDIAQLMLLGRYFGGTGGGGAGGATAGRITTPPILPSSTTYSQPWWG